jgi:carbonic anhydrase
MGDYCSMMRNSLLYNVLRYDSAIFLAIFLANFLFSFPLQAKLNDSGATVPWSYTGNLGPLRWGQLDPRFLLCAAGSSQSPINIGAKYQRIPYQLSVNYSKSPLIMEEDGETELTIDRVETLVNMGHGVQVNFHGNAADTITYHSNPYQLIQFHFHSPSETLWHGQSFPLEIHLVHQGRNGKVLVIAVFVSAGKENPTLTKIIRHLPLKAGKEEIFLGEKINPIDLLPINKIYYSYMGSLTTPPCTENIQWLVMPNVITATPAQIARLRSAIGGSNARPVQPVNNRIIYLADTSQHEKPIKQ